MAPTTHHTPSPSTNRSEAGNFHTHCAEGKIHGGPDGVDGWPPLTWEVVSQIPYIGWLVMGAHWDLPELQVGLPSEEKGSEVRGGDT